MYSAVSPYPHSALAAWQLALIAVVAFSGVAVWLGAVFLAAREPRAHDHAAASGTPAQGPASTDEAEPERGHRAAA
jgi:membrane protein implicated in regulation of membrane protease activity